MLPITAIPLYGYVKREPLWNNSNSETNGEKWFFQLIKSRLKLLVDVGVRETLTYPDDGKCIQHCFEPNPDFVQLLGRYANDHVFINPKGLGSEEKTVEYFRHSESSRRRAVYSCPVDCACKTTMHITTLDTYCAEKKISQIDFLKIDTEGYELEVLRGASQILTQTNIVQFEYGGTYPDNHITLGEVHAFLKAKGFVHLYLICPGYVLEMPNPPENYQYANYVATKVPLHELV